MTQNFFSWYCIYISLCCCGQCKCYCYHYQVAIVHVLTIIVTLPDDVCCYCSDYICCQYFLAFKPLVCIVTVRSYRLFILT